ncbi:hypothetical protein [[Phormidium] sp. ETS-05]|uniref:hypothetical protein n=1 Tax=[Phormidium] sp. ETS-05 TaxID=222819 RepID=UPI0018EECDC6|nr:hypothetical protein [[Phormidium] sp. ETS-05]
MIVPERLTKCCILSRIQEAAHRIERRFAPIQSPEDFTASEEELDRLSKSLSLVGRGI